MAVTTIDGHVSRALDFYNKTDLYFVLGHPNPWDIEAKPPEAKVTDKITDPLGYLFISTKLLVRPLTNLSASSITYRDTKWELVDINECYQKQARWVYMTAFVEYDMMSTDAVYRQIGICTGLTRKPNVLPGQLFLLPSDVESPGVLEVIDNRKPKYRELDQREKVSCIIEF